jgi:hypothetical protein
MKDPKQFEGKITHEDLLTALTKNYKTIGHFWDEEVPCKKCPFEGHCDTLTSLMESQGKYITCIDVINILLGDRTVESFPTKDTDGVRCN